MEMQQQNGQNTIEERTIEQILPHIGDFGRYQKLLILVLSIVLFPISMQPMFAHFATMTPSWQCSPSSTVCTLNGTFTSSSRCNMNRSDWTYTKGPYYSIATQFDLACDQKWLLSLINTMFFVGWGIGAVLMGTIADRYGRKKVIMPCVFLIFVSGLVSPFVPDVYMLIVLRFLVGLGYPGAMVQISILITEFVGNDIRPTAKFLLSVAFKACWIVLGLKAYLLEDWKYLSIACTAPYFPVLFLHFFIPESARWLHSNNRPDEAMSVLQNVARWNRTSIPSNTRLTSSDEITVYKPKSNVSSVFKTKTLAIHTLVQLVIWMTTSLLTYGLQFASKQLGGSAFRNYFLLSAAGVPAVFVASYMNRKLGRKVAALGPLFVAGFMCLAIACIPERENLKVLRIVLGIIGKMSGSMTFFTLYIWCAEIYPTTVRAVGMGLMQVSARIGSGASPWVVNQLAGYGKWIPFVLIGVLNVVGAALGLLLPETKGTELKESV